MALQASREIELQQDVVDLARLDPCTAHDLVDIDRTWPKGFQDLAAFALDNFGKRAGISWSSLEESSVWVPPAGLPRMGARASTMSPATVTSVAPCLRKLFVSAARGSSGIPSTVNTSRPCWPAKRAVMSEPDRWAAATTSTPMPMHEINRLRRGKSFARGVWPGVRSLMRRRRSPIASWSTAFSGG